jgi:hypothetical protein
MERIEKHVEYAIGQRVGGDGYRIAVEGFANPGWTVVEGNAAMDIDLTDQQACGADHGRQHLREGTGAGDRLAPAPVNASESGGCAD